MARIADNTTAHGLRQHSIGNTFPVIVVGLGDGSFNLELGKDKATGFTTSKSAYEMARYVAGIYRNFGWNQAIAALKAL